MTGEKGGEFRGKTIEAAVNAGLTALQLSREEIEVEVVRPGSRGVLGIGAEDAIVRLTEIRPERPQPVSRAEPRPVRVEPKPAPEPRPSEPWSAPRPPNKVEARPEPVKTPGSAAEAEVDGKDWAAAEVGKEFLAGLLGRAGLRVTVEVVAQSEAEAEEGDRVPVLNIVGDDLGALIGRQNEVLSAIEFITRLAVNQQSHTRSQFTVDVNGYRAKRAESLHKLGLRMAEQVVQSGRTVSLEPMPPSERRIVHLALRDHPKVFTQSIGEGDRRKVTIVLKKD